MLSMDNVTYPDVVGGNPGQGGRHFTVWGKPAAQGRADSKMFKHVSILQGHQKPQYKCVRTVIAGFLSNYRTMYIIYCCTVRQLALI